MAVLAIATLLLACSGPGPGGVGPLSPDEAPEPHDGILDGSDLTNTDSKPFYGDEATCSERALPNDGGPLMRWPYVQRVTSTEAVILFGTSPEHESATVRWGSDDAYAGSVESTPTAVPVGPEPLDSAEEQPVMNLHEAVLTGLSPGQQLCYQVEVGGEVVTTGLRFWTAPESRHAPARFMVIGDYGNNSEDALAVRDAMLDHADGVHFLLTAGDNAYGGGDWDELDRNVFAVYRELFAELAVFPTTGNHDYFTDQAAPYLASFALPENALKPDHAERYWSTDWGALHLVGLDTEDPAREISDEDEQDQADWLAADLAASDRPWTVAAFHKPAFSGHPDRQPDPHAVEHFVPLLEERGAALVFQGHDHFYERYEPMKGGVPTPLSEGGTTWIVTGGGGASLYPVQEEPNQAVAQEIHHFVLVDITDCTVHVQAIDLEGELVDDWWDSRCD